MIPCVLLFGIKHPPEKKIRKAQPVETDYAKLTYFWFPGSLFRDYISEKRKMQSQRDRLIFVSIVLFLIIIVVDSLRIHVNDVIVRNARYQHINMFNIMKK